MAGRGREVDLGDHLIRPGGGGVEALEELGHRDGALTARAGELDPCAQQHGEQAPFGGRVGVRDAAAERAAGPDRVVPDPPRRPGQHAEAVQHGRVAAQFDGPVPGQRADPQAVRPGSEVVQSRDAGDVNQGAGPGQPEVHHRDQTLPARQDLGPVAQLGQQGHRLRHGPGPVVAERGWLHRPPPGCRGWCWVPVVVPVVPVPRTPPRRAHELGIPYVRPLARGPFRGVCPCRTRASG